MVTVHPPVKTAWRPRPAPARAILNPFWRSRRTPSPVIRAFYLGAPTVHSVHISKINIAPNRQRRDFDPEALQELKTSIEDRGLMHPVVLRQENELWYLVAGERRLRAIRELYELGEQFVCNGTVFKEGAVPFVTLGELTVLEAEEAELDENLKRRDLTWQETADAHARLHALRVKQKELEAGNYLSGMAARGFEPSAGSIPRQSVADTARELHGRADGAYQDNVRKEIIVARHLDNPEVAKAKSLDEAFKVLKRQEESRKNVALAASVGASFTADLHQLRQADCLDWMRGCMPDTFDVILTDPPYGMNAHEFGDGGGKLQGIEHRYDDSYESWQKLMSVWTKLSFIVAKPQAHAYVFCDIDRYHELKAMMEVAGWYVHRTPLIVHKQNSGRVPLPDRGPRRQWEMILYAIKGNKPTTHIYPDVIPCTADENMSHGAQKPVSLYENLLQRSVRPGDTVLDTFAGSGTIFPAAHTYKCKAVGVEMNPEYFGMALRRIKELKQLEEPGLF